VGRAHRVRVDDAEHAARIFPGRGACLPANPRIFTGGGPQDFGVADRI
jgi:hypothetical protein